jgi:CBS domain-containing protein/Flp pilus assembly pilin Flp
MLINHSKYFRFDPRKLADEFLRGKCFIRRLSANADGASAVEYAVLLSILIAFVSGILFLGSGINDVYRHVSTSFPEGNGGVSEGTAGLVRPNRSPSDENLLSGIDAWKVATLYSVLGVGLIAGSAYATYRRPRKKPIVPAAPERPSEIPLSIQVALFEKRQHLFHSLLKDREGLWQDGIQVRHLMTTGIQSVLPTVPMPEIVALVREKGLRHLLVCDGDKKLLGVISDRDLCSKRTGTARDLMSSRLNTTTPETPINQAITCMIQDRISCLPVVENDRLCGLITTTDLMLALQCTLQIWGFFTELLQEDFSGDLEKLQKEMADQSRQIDASLTVLRRLQNDNPLPEIVPLFEQLHRAIEKMHEISAKIDHYRSHCLDNVKMVQKLTDM